MIITNKIIKRGQSINGGWSRKQISLFGIDKFYKNWRKRIIGQEFPSQIINQFVNLKNKHLKHNIKKKKGKIPVLKQIKTDLANFYYYLNACVSKDKKIALFKEYANKKYSFKHRKPLEVRRNDFLTLTKRKLSRLLRSPKFRICSICFNPIEIRHHIIQLQNGGDNRKKNIITLCSDCHEEIHPWMKLQVA